MICIYCHNDFDPTKGQGDHIIPAMLTDSLMERFRGACSECNNRIGASEAQLIRCGPEAIAMRISDPPRRREQSKAWIGAMGAPAPRMTGKYAGVHFVIRPNNGDPSDPEPQETIAYVDDNGALLGAVEVSPKMSSQSVRAKLDSIGAVDPAKLQFHILQRNSEWMEGVLAELFPGKALKDKPTIEAGEEYTIEGKIDYVFNDHYYRAIAKVAFHYFLVYSRLGAKGDEPEFEALREFIKTGKNGSQHFKGTRNSPVYFGSPYGGQHGCSNWFHTLAADCTQDWIVVYLHLFVGPPDHMAQPHYVLLGRAPAVARMPNPFAHIVAWTPGDRSKARIMPIPIVAGFRPLTVTGPTHDGSTLNAALYTLYTDDDLGVSR